MNINDLIKKSREVQEKAYAPFSKFQVGAVLEGESGKIYTGCNVENSSYGLSNCAERTAIFKAVSEGERKFRQIVITSSGGDFITPCGACRQVLYEFAPDLDIVLTNSKDEFKIIKLRDLLPEGFRFSDN